MPRLLATEPGDTVPAIDAFLRARGIAYRAVWRGAHCLSDDCVAKTLLLVDGPQHALAVVPQGRRIDVANLNGLFRRSFVLGGLADVIRLYPGVPLQSLLPAGIDRHCEFFVDDGLADLDDVALETRDPRRLLVIDGDDFRSLFHGAWRSSISAAY